MATPRPALASPISTARNTFPSLPSDGDADSESAFDFLSFMGLDGSSEPQANMNGFSQPEAEAGPSHISTHSAQSKPMESQRDGLVDQTESKRTNQGRSRKVGKKSFPVTTVRSTGTGSGQGMDVDQNFNAMPFSPSQLIGLPPGQGSGGAEMGLGDLHQGGDFDTSMLQQLENIHMHSPNVFDPSNRQQSHHPLAQLYMAAQFQAQHGKPMSFSEGDQAQTPNDNASSKWPGVNRFGGIITPGPSGEMFPQTRPDLMSPTQLEMLARAKGIDGMPAFNSIPLLSPALSQQTGNSSYASPALLNAFQGSYPSSAPNSAHAARKSPLEELQEQQRQFQQQLILLQHQQRQLEASAAAVAATSTKSSASLSPYQPSSASRSSPVRPISTANLSGPQSANSLHSPGMFSPLTSPALDASNRPGQFNHHPFSRPHSLSALSSPALNPVGTSGGGQQTLSPALGPQNSNTDLTDPDYIRALVGLLESQDSTESTQQREQTFHSAGVTDQHGQNSSPSIGSSGAAGPHRHALSSKSRPSPMMKPTNHRSHARHGSAPGSKTPGRAFSVPSSPVAQMGLQRSSAGMKHLPPSLIQPNHPQYTNSTMASGSTPSTPSPVDLTHMMPPTPVPANGVSKGFTPMTPASLMNLGYGAMEPPTRNENATPVPPPRRPGKTASAPAPLPPKAHNVAKRNGATAATRQGVTGRPASHATGKRALAMRPPAAGVGVRAGTKAAAAAAAIPLLEGETRKSSHKVAEQKRRDSLKAGFDELRLLLPPINTEALDPESGEPIPGSSAPRLLPKSSMVPDDNPNRGVSKVALLKFGNEYIERLHDKVEKRDAYVDKLRKEVRRLRGGSMEEVRGDEGEDLLEMDMLEGEEEELVEEAEQGYGEEDEHEDGVSAEDEDEMDVEDEDEPVVRRRKSSGATKSPALRAVGSR